MCDTCGCGEGSTKAVIRLPGEMGNETNDGDSSNHQHAHNHSHEHGHNHDHSHDHSHDNQRITLETDILKANNMLAEKNKGFLEALQILAINLMSSPGSGKTSLLERTIADLGKEVDFYVVEGDQQTLNDANRIEAAGASAVQINTGNGCHLDADMVYKAFKKLNMKRGSVLMIENVGNLVCPSLFSLGEKRRVVIMSVTEGEDKPAKYPTIFESADICLINKIDLLPYLDYDLSIAKESGNRVNKNLKFIELSAKSGEGMDLWYKWLREEMTGNQ